MPTFALDPAQIARMQESARGRERTRVAQLLTDRRDLAFGAGDIALADALNEVIEALHGSLGTTPPAAGLRYGARVHDGPAQDEGAPPVPLADNDPGDGFPLLQHRSDEEEASIVLRTLSRPVVPRAGFLRD
jgi:hypothetical protein